jgi:endonuclease YncB( thermonuclease family)
MRIDAILAGVIFTGVCASLAVSEPSTLTGPPFVIDGDTLVINSTHIRLWGIDAPEMHQPFGPQAKQMLQSMGGPITCNQKAVDKYKRIVAQCFIDKVDVGSKLVSLGYAWDYTQYSKGYYKQEQMTAQKEHLGLWQQSNPQPPWEFRHGH